jgi:hypothetical protein
VQGSGCVKQQACDGNVSRCLACYVNPNESVRITRLCVHMLLLLRNRRTLRCYRSRIINSLDTSTAVQQGGVNWYLMMRCSSTTYVQRVKLVKVWTTIKLLRQTMVRVIGLFILFRSEGNVLNEKLFFRKMVDNGAYLWGW